MCVYDRELPAEFSLPSNIHTLPYDVFIYTVQNYPIVQPLPSPVFYFFLFLMIFLLAELKLLLSLFSFCYHGFCFVFCFTHIKSFRCYLNLTSAVSEVFILPFYDFRSLVPAPHRLIAWRILKPWLLRQLFLTVLFLLNRLP